MFAFVSVEAMIGDERFNRHRRLIISTILALHVAVLLSRAHAQPMSPSSLQQNPHPSKAIVFAVLLSLFFFIGFLSVYLRNCSGSDTTSAGWGSRRSGACSRWSGLDDCVVETFPVFAYSSVKDCKIGSGALECAVCLSEFKENQMLRLIPRCNHVFHIDCIDPWLQSHDTCPVCRAKLAPYSGEDEPPITESVGAESTDPENSETNRVRDHIAIDIEGDRARDAVTIDAVMRNDRRQLGSGIARKFPRSNSTGHSLGQLRGTTERYTLRLPEDVRKRIMAAGGGRRLKRTRSYDGGGGRKYEERLPERRGRERQQQRERLSSRVG
ncbi:PREDICTED: RING-H2 finger protein ATL32-like [Tarenaya hassleriana]|uniref:RING-H2 finger protein ATL32-like n=1 Tax=Tarenaya hassleriana TaxID=28532 RepID=UPI00053C5382|nr:PREDICTED: RING-H2 finger protein ATL32-like [Tarenaya hassleriana]